MGGCAGTLIGANMNISMDRIKAIHSLNRILRRGKGKHIHREK
jgi:sulfatase maturation enzyme AslB (radical SAM superfamily)